MLTGPLPEKVDHRKLVNDHAKLEGTIPLERFTRLVQSLKSTAGDVQVKLGFRKGRKHRTGVVGKAQVSVNLECQACLELFEYPLEVVVRLTLVNSETVLRELSREEDGLVVEEKLVRLVDLLEDEMVLGLPMIARHMDGECGDGYRQIEDLNPPPETDKGTYKPFAGLSNSQKK